MATSMLRQLFTAQPDLAQAAVAFLLLLLAVTVGYLILSWRDQWSGLPKIGSRIEFLWVLTAVFWASILISPKLLILYIAFIAFLAFKEFLSITPTRRADRRVLFCAYWVIPIQFFFIWRGWREAFNVFAPIVVFLVLPMIMVVVGETRGFLRAWSALGWGIITTVFSLGYLAYLLVLPLPAASPASGSGLFLFLVGLAQLNHAAQYYFGKRFADPRLSLKVSTTRNWASLVGSMVVTAPVAMLIGPKLVYFGPLVNLALGLLISVGGFIGYIILSAIKSDLQLKDRGSMTPGSGGVLNRIDAFVYTAPLYFYIIAYLMRELP
ncbi:MAG: phosphatidate cytidylyltransferase [Caldilineaceae bacterium]